MAAQKLTRKELKRDPFVIHTERVLSFIQAHATAVGAALIVVVVLIVGGTYVRQGRIAAEQEASYLLYLGQNLLSQGDYMLAMAPLEEVIEKHGRTEFAMYARVSMIQALLGVGEPAAAMARAEIYRTAIDNRHPASRLLAVVRANAMADLDRYGEAAQALAEVTTPDLPPSIYFNRTMQRARWLELAEDYTGALQLLERLDDSIASGALHVPEIARELEQRLEVVRALAR